MELGKERRGRIWKEFGDRKNMIKIKCMKFSKKGRKIEIHNIDENKVFA